MELCVRPLHPKVDVGAGPGNELCKEIEIGRHGILLDGRNRPIVWPADRSRCAAAQRDVCDALGLVVEGD
mgnify:FL=1